MQVREMFHCEEEGQRGGGDDEMMDKYEIWESNMEERRKRSKDMVEIKEKDKNYFAHHM
jgi:hypothetical protein